ncbi:MAG: hypothetical protein JWM16_1164 [Verrucomicrobiales bacterium]|nr:hypothetical protein [Verrucomicrobiales bacterium]
MRPKTIRLILLAIILSPFIALAAPDANKANETLLKASSPYEDMVEFALNKNDAGIAKSLNSAKKQAAAVRDALPAAATAKFEMMLEGLQKTAAAKERYSVATSAVEMFRLLIDGLQADNLKVPKEVSLLDYAGFKLKVLAAAPQPDWSAMREIAGDAATWWAAIKAKVTEKALRDAVNTTVKGVQQAGKLEHLPMLVFAAQMDLDLVDLLESYFDRRK